MEGARSIVVSPPAGVGEGVVGVVDLLELAGAGGPLGGGDGNAIRVRLQGGALVGFADLRLGGRGRDVEDGVVVDVLTRHD